MTEKQKQLLGLLREVDALCRRNGLRYVMAGGSLLGAVRNKGFLPWDDDIDIYMPRDDWNRLTELQDQLPEGRALIDVGHMREYTNSFPRYGSTDTCAIHRHQIIGNDVAGEIIDVLALDPIPPDDRSYRKYRADFMVYSELINPMVVYGSRWEIPAWRYLFYKGMEKLAGKEKTFRRLEKRMYAWREEECDRFAMRWGGCPFLFPRDMLFPVREMPFEDMMVYVPNHTIDYLIWHYGDEWSYVPPHAERESHECVSPKGIDYSAFRSLYLPGIDVKRLEKDSFRRKLSRLLHAKGKNAVEDDKLDLYAKGVQLDLEARFERGKRSLTALLGRRDFSSLSEIFSEYFNAQLSAGFIGREDFANIRKFEHPTLIDIPQPRFDAAMLTLFYTERISKAFRLLGLVKETKGLSEASGQLYEDIILFRNAVKEIEEGKEDQAAQTCGMLCAAYPENPSLLKLRLWLSARTDRTRETSELVRLGRTLFPEDGYFIKYEADLYWKNGDRENALSLYARVRNTTNNGMIWLDMETVPGADREASMARCIKAARSGNDEKIRASLNELRLWKRSFPDDERIRAAEQDVEFSAAVGKKNPQARRNAVCKSISERIRFLTEKEKDIPEQYNRTLARNLAIQGWPAGEALLSVRSSFTEDYEVLDQLRTEAETLSCTPAEEGYRSRLLGDILLKQGKTKEAFAAYKKAAGCLPEGPARRQLGRLVLEDLVKGQAKLRIIAPKTDVMDYLDGWLDKYGTIKEIRAMAEL